MQREVRKWKGKTAISKNIIRNHGWKKTGEWVNKFSAIFIMIQFEIKV